MSFFANNLARWYRRQTSNLVSLGGVVSMVALSMVALPARPTVAAQDVVLTYGVFERSVSVESLQKLAETGETTPTLDFLLNVTNTPPEAAQSALNAKLGVSLGFVDDVFNSLPGEYALFQLGQIFYNKARFAEIQALRAAIVLSVSEDNELTLLEFFEKYPNQELYVDGRLLSEVGNTVANFVEDTGRSLAVPLAVIKDILDNLVCDCVVEGVLPLEDSEAELSVIPLEPMRP
ncbi:alpha/beta hydrolase [Oscillatoriales cyanobacterium LEGE 11467]|uniref:Alpha/beta hydrolase n=1 Tax=Zarconia navalis LEGE 11467 TaxID=1828826 RepID=A0A928VW57_9CYAN|nr:alpha/beta hydrolase [Zarconia navalis]MBE9039238.1 alpha/beta hydrolase [Zarconia navalis LEGE 11467]